MWSLVAFKFDMVVEVEFSVGAPRIYIKHFNQAVFIRSDNIALMMHMDDDHCSVPRTIGTLGALPGIRIRLYTKPFIWICLLYTSDAADD